VQDKRSCRSDEGLAGFVLKEPSVEQGQVYVRKRSADVGCDVQEINAVRIRDVGQAIERPAIRSCNKNIVVTCISQVGAEADKGRYRNAIGWIACLADVAGEAGLITRATVNLTPAYQSNAGSGRTDAGRNQTNNSYNHSNKPFHA